MKYLVLIATILAFYACDKVKEPFIEKLPDNNDSNTVVQKVLIEDFTGQTCGNCPRAHEKIEELHSIYGSKLIAIAIHTGDFAIPNPAYPADYRTSVGDELRTFFNVQAYPKGTVNRVELSGQVLLSYGDWATVASQEFQQTPKLGIKITNTYNSTNRELSTKADLTFLENVSDEYKICFYITEDSIVSPQTDYDATPNKIPNYVHRHILRGSINGTWGSGLTKASYITDETESVTKQTTLNAAWNENKCSVVVYVYRVADNKIIQVEEKHLVNH